MTGTIGAKISSCMICMSGVTSVSSVGWMVRSACFQRAAHGDLGALGDGIIEELLDAREILVVDDLGDVFLLDAAVVPVEVLPYLRPELLDQGALLLLLDEHIVGADAGLPAIELLGCRQVPRNLLHVRAFIDDDGRFAAELQCHGGEILRRRRHDQLSDARAAREEDVAERQLEQRGRHVDTAFEQGDFFFIERLLDDLRGDPAVAGHRSVSLTMQQLPAAMAAARGPMVNPSGKFQGPRMRHTPRAS